METLYLELTIHAKFDCIPLRFGFVPNVDVGVLRAIYDEIGTQNQKPKEIRLGNKHYKGELELTDGQIVSNATFVVSSNDRIVSVFWGDSRVNRAVGEIVRDMRIDGKIDSYWIVDNLYGPYRNGKVKTASDMIDLLVEIGVREQTLTQKEPSTKELDEQRKKDQELEATLAENTALKKHIKEAEKQGLQYNGEDIAIAPPCTLVKVERGERQNFRGELVECTFLHFEESVPMRTMDKWADPEGTITARATQLIGSKVHTTSWKPKVFSPLNWFRNIYKA